MEVSHYSQIPEKPLIAGMSTAQKDINQVFFFERNDGQIIATEEREAWGLYARPLQILGTNRKVNYKLVGTGKGNIFREALMKAQQVGKTDIKQAQEIIRKGQQDELEACRGHIIAPRNMDKVDL
jgi:hypothetical protein